VDVFDVLVAAFAVNMTNNAPQRPIDISIRLERAKHMLSIDQKIQTDQWATKTTCLLP
jgi:hypothetical protein